MDDAKRQRLAYLATLLKRAHEMAEVVQQAALADSGSGLVITWKGEPSATADIVDAGRLAGLLHVELDARLGSLAEELQGAEQSAEPLCWVGYVRDRPLVSTRPLEGMTPVGLDRIVAVLGAVADGWDESHESGVLLRALGVA